jgi:hypothetical protein
MRSLLRPAGLAATAFLLLVAAPGVATASRVTAASQTSASLTTARTFKAPGRVTHVALHWRGARNARVRIALSRDGRRFGRPLAVGLDEVAEGRGTRETYGRLFVAPRVRAVRVSSDRPLPRLTVLWLGDRGRPASGPARPAAVAQPAVTSRAGWGADESLRYDAGGKEVWPAAFYPVQKLIVHHTDTANSDPNPAATVRSIYYYHAVTQAWGDIGYNFLVDQQGRVYEGRRARAYAPGETPTEEDASGRVVTGAHAQGFNSGTVGIALLGTLTGQDATPAARQALVRLLAWEADRHGIDPQGASLFTNPVSGTQLQFPNIAGHRDVNATECPGGVFYGTLPSIRSDVAAMVSPAAPSFTLSASPSSAGVVRGKATAYTVSVTRSGGFSSPVTLSVSGLPGGATASVSPNPATNSSRVTVATSTTTPVGTYTVRIAGSGGGLSRSTSVTLQVKRR